MDDMDGVATGLDQLQDMAINIVIVIIIQTMRIIITSAPLSPPCIPIVIITTTTATTTTTTIIIIIIIIIIIVHHHHHHHVLAVVTHSQVDARRKDCQGTRHDRGYHSNNGKSRGWASPQQMVRLCVRLSRCHPLGD